MRRTHVGSLAITSFLVIVLGVLGIGTAMAAPTPAPSTGSGESVPGKLLLMLDASGSMLEADPSGLTRMDAAKQGLSAVVDKLPDNAQVGLRVYGATVMGGTPTPEACADTQLVHPIGTIDKTGLKAAINGFAAKGETPIAHSLQKALEDLGTTGKRNIILVSDGEESCVPDPCPVIKELIGNGIDLQIDTVGYAVGDKARQQLQCIANAAHGTYYDAANADQIAASINKLSQRAMRPFRVTGTPIKGTHDAATAPELTAGQYTDAITEGEDAAHQLKYRIKRTIPGSTLHVSTAALPKVSGVVGKEAWSLILDEPGGRNCGMDASGQSSYTSLMALGVSSASSVDACNESESLTLTVTRRYGAESPAPAPFEVRVIEEPRVTNLDQLPDGAGRAKPEVTEVAADGPGTPVVGGTALSDALSLTPGTYVEELVPGEASFYRIPVAYGQRLRFTLLGIGESFPWKTSYRDTWFMVGADILGPTARQAAIIRSAALWTGPDVSEPRPYWTPEIRYKNRSDVYTDGAALAGTYTIAVAITKDSKGIGAVEGIPVPVRFAVTVDGTESGKPEYAAAMPSTASPSPSASATTPAANAKKPVEADNGSVLPLVGGGLLTLAVLGGIGYAVWRRRAQGATHA